MFGELDYFYMFSLGGYLSHPSGSKYRTERVNTDATYQFSKLAEFQRQIVSREQHKGKT